MLLKHLLKKGGNLLRKNMRVWSKSQKYLAKELLSWEQRMEEGILKDYQVNKEILKHIF